MKYKQLKGLTSRNKITWKYLQTVYWTKNLNLHMAEQKNGGMLGYPKKIQD